MTLLAVRMRVLQAGWSVWQLLALRAQPSENGNQLSVDLFHLYSITVVCTIFLYVYDDICFCLSDQCKRSHVAITKIGKHSSILLFALSFLAISAKFSK